MHKQMELTQKILHIKGYMVELKIQLAESSRKKTEELFSWPFLGQNLPNSFLFCCLLAGPTEWALLTRFGQIGRNGFLFALVAFWDVSRFQNSN